MKTFNRVMLFVLLLSGLAGYVRADTVGPYEVRLRKQVITRFYDSEKNRVVIEKDSVTIEDTLLISRVACPGSDPFLFEIKVVDSVSNSEVSNRTYNRPQPYKIPLKELLEWEARTGNGEFKVYVLGLQADMYFYLAIEIRLE